MCPPICPRRSKCCSTAYAPPGIEAEAVRLHLQDIQANVLIVSPNARTDVLEVLTAE